MLKIWLTSGFRNAVTVCNIQDTNCLSDDSARQGQNQEKENNPIAELNNFLSKFLLGGKKM